MKTIIAFSILVLGLSAQAQQQHKYCFDAVAAKVSSTVEASMKEKFSLKNSVEVNIWKIEGGSSQIGDETFFKVEGAGFSDGNTQSSIRCDFKTQVVKKIETCEVVEVKISEDMSCGVLE